MIGVKCSRNGTAEKFHTKYWPKYNALDKYRWNNIKMGVTICIELAQY